MLVGREFLADVLSIVSEERHRGFRMAYLADFHMKPPNI